MAEALARLRSACAKAGRDPRTLTVSARMGLSSRQPAEDTLAEVRALRDLGVDHLILEPGVRDADTMTAVLERFASNVRDRL
jgi:alkanesulfonate monooxygenase SsuD/methylene tetrahydromethanopterin reductase-like flavin-dependent oxidoreductase (luciferase family)